MAIRKTHTHTQAAPQAAQARRRGIVAASQGAILLARTVRDKAPIQAALDTLLLLIDNAR